MNRLQEILIKETGNKNISRDTGRSLVNSQNIIALYILGFLNPVNFSSQIERIYKTLSRAATIQINYLKDNSYEFVTTPIPGIKEEYYQCKNRIGSLEGLLKIFLQEYPKIEHPECYHKGANHCRYIISWDKFSKILNWIKVRNFSIVIGMILSTLTLIFFPFTIAMIAAFFSLSIVLFLTHHAFRLKQGKMQKDFSEFSQTAEELWNELNIRYSSTKLVQEVGEITSVILNEKEISSAVSSVMSKRLDYYRGAILLAANDKKSLFFAGGFGYSEDEITIMNSVQFRLDNPLPEGILQRVFTKQEPVLIEDVNKIASTFNEYNLNIAQKLKIQAMVCVPILHEGRSMGIMMVDSLRPQRELREGDVNLLVAVASQTAISIAHARAYQKLHASEKKHRTLVETIRDIVYTVDLEGRFTYVSPMVEIITGYRDSELYGRQITDIVSPQHKDMVIERYKEGIETGGSSTYQIEIIAKDGRHIPVELNVTTLTDNMSQPLGRIGVARDITRRHQEEAKRQEMEMRALTQDKLASLGEIATGIAHEINQPLSYIKVILESTLDDVYSDKVDNKELSEDFDESLRQVGKISNIISHLRTFGRSDVTSFNPVKLSRVLDDTLILMNERLRMKNISLDKKITDDFPLLLGNHVKLEQVFINLIQNSMDAMEEQVKGEITLSAEVETDEALITYSDNGGGIAPQLQEKIFEPFFTTKEAGKGTGIGLSIVYGIIQEHNGSITCESEVGKGATFKIRLPVYAEQNPE